MTGQPQGLTKKCGADEVGAWQLPEDLRGIDVFMKKSRARAYYKYIRLKDIVHEES